MEVFFIVVGLPYHQLPVQNYYRERMSALESKEMHFFLLNIFSLYFYVIPRVFTVNSLYIKCEEILINS